MKKRLSFLLIISVVLVGYAQKKNDRTATNNTIDAFLNSWHKAAAEANYTNYFTKMDSLSVFIGTDATENWNKQQFATFSKPYFDDGKAWSFSTLERNIYTNAAENFVWFDELLDTWMGICRGSGVLEKTKNSWKIKHYVLSVTVPNDQINEVVKRKQKKDSVFLSRFK